MALAAVDNHDQSENVLVCHVVIFLIFSFFPIIQNSNEVFDNCFRSFVDGVQLVGQPCRHGRDRGGRIGVCNLHIHVLSRGQDRCGKGGSELTAV